jgi:hypothetical protein
MPPSTSNPLTGYVHANLLEEGYIELTKTVLENAEDGKNGVEMVVMEGGGSSDEEEEDDAKDHENLQLKWTWTELKR